MECTEARWLLDRGVEPGAGHATRTRLGFHLSGCAECRAYHRAVHQSLLADLLSAPSAAPRPAQPARPAPRRSPTVRAAQVGGTILAIAILLVVGRIASAALTIRQNVQAYIVPTAGDTPLRTAAPALGGSGDSLPRPAPRPAAHAAPTGEAPAPSAQPAATPAASGASSPAIPTLVPIQPTSGAQGALIPTLESLTATPRIPLAGDAITILLLGSDRRPDEQGPSRTDTVIVARVDPARKRVALLSLPRDMIVAIPGYGYDRINAANVIGDIYPEYGGGLKLARATVSQLLGVPIDYAVMVDFSGFTGLIDAIGGVDIDVPQALYDPQYPTMDYGYMEVAFDAGQQHMDGTRALQYARIRHMDSDFERARRQQEIILAAARRLRDQNPLALLDSIASATSALRGYVSTDIPEERLVGLAWALRDVSPSSVERYLVDENMVSFNGEGGGCSSADDYWAECTNPDSVRALVQRWLGAGQ